MRLFIASPVKLDDYQSIQKDFAGIIEGKWVEEENLHLTWVFWGETKNEGQVIEKLSGCSSLTQAVAIGELGYFGRPPKVFFAKAQEKILFDKARELKEAGFDLYRFKPHITLCRIKHIHDYKAYKEKMKSYRDRELGIILPRIALYRSMLSREGPQYTCRFSLEEER